ncbi:MAG: ankyrin repeat domain-containing protein [Campylobacteraceae bacterium]
MQVVLSKQEEDRYVELQYMALDFARKGESEILQSMIEHGLSVNLEDAKGNTLLMLSSYNGNFETTKMLITLGADIEKTNSHGHTPLAGVAFKGYLDICKLLVENGAKIKAKNGKSAITVAAIFGRSEIVEYLQSAAKEEDKILGVSSVKIASFIQKVKNLF